MTEENIRFVIEAMLFVFLGLAAYFDCRFRRIPWSVLGMGTIFMIISNILQWKEFKVGILSAALPGLFLLVLAWLTKESIGYGDGISVILLGGMVGLRNCIWVLCISLLLLSLAGLVLLVIKRVDRKTKIPYLPFLLAAESVLLCCHIM